MKEFLIISVSGSPYFVKTNFMTSIELFLSIKETGYIYANSQGHDYILKFEAIESIEDI